MRSFKRNPDNRRQVYLALVGQVEGQLRDVYAKRHEAGLETQSSVAEKLGVHRSVVHHRLTGRQNMTLETLADMAWALGCCIAVDIYDPADRPSNRARVIPSHITPSASAPAKGRLVDSAREPTAGSGRAIMFQAAE